MKPRRFTEEQIIGILKQAQAGMKIVEVPIDYQARSVEDGKKIDWPKALGMFERGLEVDGQHGALRTAIARVKATP